jgi:hypothetical protein
MSSIIIMKKVYDPVQLFNRSDFYKRDMYTHRRASGSISAECTITTVAVPRFHTPLGLMAIIDEPWTIGMEVCIYERDHKDIYISHVICTSATTKSTTMHSNEVVSHDLNVCRICTYVTD